MNLVVYSVAYKDLMEVAVLVIKKGGSKESHGQGRAGRAK